MKKYSLAVLCVVANFGAYLFGMEHTTSSREELTTIEEAVTEDLLHDLETLRGLCTGIKRELEGQNDTLSELESTVDSMHISATRAVDALNGSMREKMKKYDAAKKYWASELDEVVHDVTRQGLKEVPWSGAERLVWDDCWERLGRLVVCPIILIDTIKPALNYIKRELQKLAQRAGLNNFDAEKIVDGFFVSE